MQHYGLKTLNPSTVKPIYSSVSKSDRVPSLPDMSFRDTRIYMRMRRLSILMFLHAQIRGSDRITYRVDNERRAMVRHNRAWEDLERRGWSMTFWKSRPYGYKICPVRKRIWVPKPNTIERMYPLVRAIHLAHMLVNMEDCISTKKSHGQDAMVVLPTVHTYVTGSNEEDFSSSLERVNAAYPSITRITDKSFGRFKSILDLDIYPCRVGYKSRGMLRHHIGSRFDFPMGVTYGSVCNPRDSWRYNNAVEKNTAPFAIEPKNGYIYVASHLHFDYMLSSLKKSAHFVSGVATWRLFGGKSKSLRAITSCIHVLKSDVEALYALVSDKKYKNYWDGLNRDNIISHIQSLNALLHAKDRGHPDLSPGLARLRSALIGPMSRTRKGRNRFNNELLALPAAWNKLPMSELLSRLNNVERGLANAIDELRLSVAKIVATENEKEKTQ